MFRWDTFHGVIFLVFGIPSVAIGLVWLFTEHVIIASSMTAAFVLFAVCRIVTGLRLERERR